MKRFILIYKPENLSHKEFSSKVTKELSQHSEVANLNPVKLCKKLENIYYVFGMKRPVEELGYKSLLFPLTREQIVAIKEQLANGNMDEENLRSITPENIIDVTHPVDAPIEKQVSLRDIGSTEFEKKVTNIIRILYGNGAKVKWNQRMKDHSNPSQSRQIDIEIRKDGKKYHMECRHRSTPQDVQWIEQLIGRKTTLRVDGIAGVSSSGFSKTAKKTAAKFDVPLWELSEFNNVDALLWVGDFRFSMTTYKIKKVGLFFKLFNDNQSPQAINEINNVIEVDSILWRNIEENLNKLSLLNLKEGLVPRCTYLYEFPLFFDNNFKYIESISAKMNIECVTLHAQRINKHSFGVYQGEFLNTDAIVEERILPNFKIEVVHSEDKIDLILEHEKIEDGNFYYTCPIIKIESGDVSRKKISIEIKNSDSLKIFPDCEQKIVDNIERNISLRQLIEVA